MIRGGKTCWKGLQVHWLHGPGAGRDELGELSAAERLAALYRFQNGDVAADCSFVEGRTGAEVHDPADVDWDTFPVLAALEAVTRDELRRLRHILREDPANAVDEEPAAPTASGTWALPSFGALETARPRSASSSDV